MTKEKSSNRAFTSMLTNTLRNHYTLNQMVDRKARILLTINVIVLSFVIGKIMGNQLNFDLNFLVLIGASISCVISIIFAVLAVMPESHKKKMTEQGLKGGQLNPLYFGNYLSMPLELFENTMMAMSNDLHFTHRSLLKDIYFIGSVLERKRKFLRYSLTIMTVGICTLLVVSIVFRFMS